MADRAKDMNKALKAVGRVAVNKHKGYYRTSGNQNAPGGGPPGDPWPALSPVTVIMKEKGYGDYRGGNKTQKLVNTGLLSNGYEYEVSGEVVSIFNNEDEKVNRLQKEGVGRNGKKFKVLATDPENDDPSIMEEAREIVGRFLFDGGAVD